MAGIYLHIPFCRQKCHYCNFYSFASVKYKDDFIKALLIEIAARKPFLENENIETIYFGGGTPSLLTRAEMEVILENLFKHYSIQSDPEITLEANPDDLNSKKIDDLALLPVNRLSIGIQSFFADDLHYLNRVHSAEQAEQSILLTREAGFDNLTIDLIYGMPTLTDEKWLSNIEKWKAYELPHLSAYGLTVEPKTALENLIRKRKMEPVKDQHIAGQFRMLMAFANENGITHYEISNFCNGHSYSKHNTNYWFGKKYLGLGPSAHSFDLESRYWNVSNVSKYIESMMKGIQPEESEMLSKEQKYNEYVLLSFRTKWGTDIKTIEERFGADTAGYFIKQVDKYITMGCVEQSGSTYLLSDEGKLFADRITSQLFL